MLAREVVAAELQSEARPWAYKPRDLVEPLRIPLDTIYDLLKAGTLRGRKVGTRWVVPAQAVEEFLGNPLPGEEPPTSG